LNQSGFPIPDLCDHLPLLFFDLLTPDYRNWPGLQSSRLAWPQFALFQIGAVVLVAGKFDIDSGGGGALAPPGSILVILGTLVMFWMFTKTAAEIELPKKRVT
jgi:hypothetical protein